MILSIISLLQCIVHFILKVERSLHSTFSPGWNRLWVDSSNYHCDTEEKIIVKLNRCPRSSTSQFSAFSHRIMWVPVLRSLITLLNRIQERNRERERRVSDGGRKEARKLGSQKGGKEGRKKEERERGKKYIFFQIYFPFPCSKFITFSIKKRQFSFNF